MKHRIAGLALALALTAPLLPTARAAAPDVSVNGAGLGADAMACVVQNTTYVSLRTVASALAPNAVISWEDGAAVVRAPSMTLRAALGGTFLEANGRRLAIPQGVLAQDGRVLVPVRVLAAAFGAQVAWDPASGGVAITSTTQTSTDYDYDDLYWLSRIISAESRGEPLEGKIAVGNVVLNRVASPDFPDTIFDVIFDDRWGGQFEPVRNSTVYQEPTEESILAAKLCLDGADAVGDCLYFLAPTLAQNFWTVENREFVISIGCHDFYR